MIASRKSPTRNAAINLLAAGWLLVMLTESCDNCTSPSVAVKGSECPLPE